MKQKIELYNHFFFTVLLAAMFLSGLLVTVGFVSPSQAAAHNLIINPQGSTDQDTSATVTSPPTSFVQASSVITLYLPLIFRNPVIVYFDDFNNSDSDWQEVDDGNCSSAYDSGRYRLTIDRDETCIPRAAPGAAARTYGEFETAVYHSGENESDGKSNAVFGIFTNGQGGGNYYIFKIRPNLSTCATGGGWEFIRRKNNTEVSLARVDCTAVVSRGFGNGAVNTLRFRHDKNGVITLYINNVQVFINTEAPANELLGTTTGIFAESASDVDSVIKYDYFRVFSIP